MTQPIIALVAAASMAASPQPAKPNAAEAAFIASATHALTTKYATASDATAAGYMRMTRLESDGTIIYATMRYDRIDADHPNFLWYDRHGKVVGLDYEYPVASWPKPPGPHVYPVAANRWTTVPAHVHFAYRVGNGPIQYHGARLRPNLTGPKITADELRADKLLPANATLLWAEYHPKCWDLGFWTVPNPNGAFADLDPLVK